ncbi:hypothetical protein Fmac_008392 [Flemingia macrophylla]|uniref:pectinesterase n=1 Tax=Flemingia macrophylla TaxID=520843 RepID=A0ABD1MX92_9FABA
MDSDLRVNEKMLSFEKCHNEVQVIFVNQIGEGHSKTVQGAVDMVPDYNKHKVKIYIYLGIYRKKVYVPASKPYISFVGKRNQTASAVITWNGNSFDKGANGQALGTYNSATVGVDLDYFCATENSVIVVASGKGMQVTLRVNGPRAMFYRVRIK